MFTWIGNRVVIDIDCIINPQFYDTKKKVQTKKRKVHYFLSSLLIKLQKTILYNLKLLTTII